MPRYSKLLPETQPKVATPRPRGDTNEERTESGYQPVNGHRKDARGAKLKFKITLGILGAVALTVGAGAGLAFERGQVRETKSMAQQLAASAERVSVTAQRQQGRLRGSERRMLVALQRFSDSAGRFRDTLETYFRSPGEVQQTLALLNEDSAVVDQSIRRARPMLTVLQDWDNCTRLLERINGRFERSVHANAGRRDDRAQQYYESGGQRYPRNGNTYYRDGQWVQIVAAPAVADDSRWYTVDGNRYRRDGNLYNRDGRWVPIPAEKTTVKSVLRGLLTDR
jgi:hypothetical protein